MSDTLRDQLLKAGLVDEKKLRQSRQTSKGSVRKRKAAKGVAPTARHDDPLERTRREQAERSRELNRNRQEAAARKESAAQIRQIIETHRLPREDGDLPYHFQHGQRIRRIHVTREQQERLSRGQLGIVTMAGGYELLPREALDKIRERDAERVILLNEIGQIQPSSGNDPYADYEIPDDLMW